MDEVGRTWLFSFARACVREFECGPQSVDETVLVGWDWAGDRIVSLRWFRSHGVVGVKRRCYWSQTVGWT